MEYSASYPNSLIKKMIALTILIAFIQTFGTGTMMAQSSKTAEESFLSAKKSIQAGVITLDKAQIVKGKYALQSYTESSDKELKALAHYYMGYADYRLHTLPVELSDKQKKEHLDEAVRLLEKTIELKPDFAEAHALLSAVYGMKATGIISGMKYGPKADKQIKIAREQSPENPRITLIDGISLYYKPGMFGGSVEKAAEQFEKAIQQFQTFEPENKLMPEWGYIEVYAWLGQAQKEQKNYQEARKAYRKALEIDPDYGWVKHALLPELEKQIN